MIDKLTVLEKAALLSGENTWQTRSIARLGIPSIWFSDGPHGIRKQLGSADHLGLNASEPATCFPPAATVACSWDLELAEEIGAALGGEAAAQGVQVLLGPGLNIKRSPLGGRCFEYFSEDPLLSGKLAASYVRGIQSQNVAATPKHFAVNSQELRRMVSDSIVDERTLREIYLAGFEIVVREARPWAIMSAYNLVNGVYAHENRHLLTDILRNEWGFDGAVVTDWGGANDSVASIQAGGTIEMPSSGFDSTRQLVAAIEAGELSEAELDARVAELLLLTQRTADQGLQPVDRQRHHDLARRAAAESAVLLRNDGILPLAPGVSVAIVGEFADAPRVQGAGSSAVNPTQLVSARDAFEASGLDVVGYAPGFRRDGVEDAELRASAIQVARSADTTILFLGLPESDETEGVDRAHLHLPEAQIALLHEVATVTDRVVVVLSAGGVLELSWAEETAALIHGHLGGQAGAAGIVDVLTGVVNPSGRLAETYPMLLADTPTAGYFPSTARTAEYREGVYVGYRYYETAQVAVAFPFGFGLSYTTFEYGDLEASEAGVSFTVTNTGTRAGSEVAQLYVARAGGQIHRPARELRGFAKVRLEAGERTTVRVPLGERAFRYFDANTNSWQVEAGQYTVIIGQHVQDNRLSETVDVVGTLPDDIAPCAAPASLGTATDSEFRKLLGCPLPASDWGTAPLGLNDPLERLSEARSVIARAIFRVLDFQKRRKDRAGTPDLNILFMYSMPLRALAKMSGGAASTEMIEALVTFVNGHQLRGLGQIIRSFFRLRRADRRTARELLDTSRSTTSQRSTR